jgi:hypothetical protein
MIISSFVITTPFSYIQSNGYVTSYFKNIVANILASETFYFPTTK